VKVQGVASLILLAFCLSAATTSFGQLTDDPKINQQWVPAIPTGTLACVPNAPAGYHAKSCYYEIDRDAPAPLSTLNVPGNTAVYVGLKNPHWDESIAFNATVTQTPPPNIPVDALTSLASPLSNMQTGFHAMMAQKQVIGDKFDKLAAAANDPWKATASVITTKQDDVIDDLTKKFQQIQAAGTHFTCLENYREYDSSSNSCNFTPPLTSASVSAAVDAAKADAKNAADLATPTEKIGDLTTAVSNFKCDGTTAPTSAQQCQDVSDALQAQGVAIGKLVTDIQTTQDALRQANAQIAMLASATIPPEIFFKIKQPFFRTATLNVVGTEIVTKTATTIASTTINWQPWGFVLSTGLMGSGLANRTYATSNIIMNGVVRTDPTTGKNLTIVTSTNTEPAMDFPAVFGSWVIPWINRWKWQNACPSHCTFLLSGGAGLNLTSKTADLATGPSFEVWGVMLTPVAVFGRQSVLSDGIKVGYEGFGINPPSTLPTTTAWKPGFGIALTYQLPLP
jgi:hypothetical protein